MDDVWIPASTPRVSFSPSPEALEAVPSAADSAALAVATLEAAPSALRTVSTPLFAALNATVATRRSRGPAGPAGGLKEGRKGERRERRKEEYGSPQNIYKTNTKNGKKKIMAKDDGLDVS